MSKEGVALWVLVLILATLITIGVFYMIFKMNGAIDHHFLTNITTVKKW